ncbi:hypothetical protein NLG97_g4974 [Lecanicillium saksenae]|uniref:Uncharacterized protein n=1 Tax=Lecanicillium saksenae TaxID=468837 RepID=A0ACC1QWZ3_9HYPO|nr:hypothetical protein NLG97_g4974 [Lecanicillium saksenae]
MRICSEHFVALAYPQGDCWSGFLAYTPDKLEALIEFGNEFMTDQDGNSMLSIILGNFLPPAQASGILAVVFHNGPREQGEKVFKPLLDLRPVSKTIETLPYTEVNLMFNKHPRGPRDRPLFGGANFTLPLAPERAREIGDFFWKETNDTEQAAFRSSTMTLEYHTANAIRKVGVEDTAVGFKGDAYSDGSGSYLNNFSNVTRAEKVYGPNAARLRKLKRKYDPAFVFKKNIDLSSGPMNGEH